MNEDQSQGKPQLPAFDVIGHANKLAWIAPELNVIKEKYQKNYTYIADIMQNVIIEYHQASRLVLPDMTAYGNQAVSVFSDYSGESSGRYNTYSILLCCWNLLGPFHEKMREIREKNKLGDKEISFKDFGMGQIRRAIPEYLITLNNLVPGLLVTLVVDKEIPTLFGESRKETGLKLAEILKTEGIGSWKPKAAEKLIRIVHLVAFFVGLLARDGQNIFWMTDHDEICPTREKHQELLNLFQRVLGLYARDGYAFPIIGGALPFNERSLMMLDLLSVADIVAGSVESYMSQRRTAASADEIKIKPAAADVLEWLSTDGIGLKKLNVVIMADEKHRMTAGRLDFRLTSPPEGVVEVPIFIKP